MQLGLGQGIFEVFGRGVGCGGLFDPQSILKEWLTVGAVQGAYFSFGDIA